MFRQFMFPRKQTNLALKRNAVNMKAQYEGFMLSCESLLIENPS